MDQEYIFNLTQVAKSKGGDKYVCDTIPDFNIYIPQTISRNDGFSAKTLKIIISSPQ